MLSIVNLEHDLAHHRYVTFNTEDFFIWWNLPQVGQILPGHRRNVTVYTDKQTIIIIIIIIIITEFI